MASSSLSVGCADDGRYGQLQDDEVRLLCLTRKVEDSSNEVLHGISLSFERHSFSGDTLPSFTALSYAWGDQVANLPLRVANFQIDITENLQAILETLCSNTPPERLWIDAICIHQKDPIERAAQVKLMGDIYARASHVLVFLSPLSAPFDLGMSFLERVAEHPEEHLEPSLSPHVSIDGLTLQSERLRDSVIALFATPWWTRLWVIQEFALAQKVLFRCGHRTIDGAVIHNAFENLLLHEEGCCWTSMRVSEDHPRGYLDVPSAASGGLSMYGAGLRWVNLGEIVQAEENFIYDVIGAVESFRPQSCSEPHDRIYSMMGLKLKDGRIRDRIQTSYTVPVAQLFRDVAMIAIETSGTLDVISHVLPPSIAQPTVDGLPSWVPDWNAKLDPSFHVCHQRRRERQRFYNAYGFSKPTWAPTSTGEIATEARFLGTIVVDAHGYPISKTMPSGKALLDEWVRIDRNQPETGQHPIQSNVDGDQDSRDLDFHFLITGDMSDQRWGPDSSEFKPGYTTLEVYRMWYSWFMSNDTSSSPGEAKRDIRTFDDLVRGNTLGRRLFRTDSGYVGFGPASLRFGDSVVLMPGGNVPYVLRRAPACSSNAYTFLGDAYVRGAMRSENIKSLLDEAPAASKILLV